MKKNWSWSKGRKYRKYEKKTLKKIVAKYKLTSYSIETISSLTSEIVI